MFQGLREIQAFQEAQVRPEDQEQKAAWEKWDYQVSWSFLDLSINPQFY